MSCSVRTVLVTGAGGGLGGAVARKFANRGWTVFAADLRPPTAEPNLVPITLDVSEQAPVDAAVAEVGELATEGLGRVVNFAGVLEIGPMVEISDEQLTRVLSVNVLGTYRVNRSFFPLLLEGSGRIINISSETGWQRALMFNGPYAMSKHAIEAYSDALRRELMFLGVRVVVIEPGPFRTRMTGSIDDRFGAAVEPGSPFAGLADKLGQAARREHQKAKDPEVLVEVVWKAMTTERPRARYSVCPAPKRVLLHYLPVSVADRMLRAALR